MNLIERYLTEMAETRGTRSNVAETSFYPALEHLLSEIGKGLSPRVRCVINLANRGAGIPDGGLFTADQFRRQARAASADENPFLAQTPARGVIEAKPPRDNVATIVETPQVERYWKRYGMVLVTNFRACVAGQVALIAIFNGTLALYLLLASYVFIGFLFDLYRDPRA